MESQEFSMMTKEHFIFEGEIQRVAKSNSWQMVTGNFMYNQVLRTHMKISKNGSQPP